MHSRFAPHELLEIHELLNHEVTCAQKSGFFAPSVTDSELRGFAQRCSNIRRKRIEECQGLVGHTGPGSSTMSGTRYGQYETHN